MMNMFDVCRPVQKQHVNAIIRRLIEQDGVLKTIIQEQESREKQDKELLYILKSGLKCDTAILIEHLKERGRRIERKDPRPHPKKKASVKKSSKKTFRKVRITIIKNDRITKYVNNRFII